MTQSIERRSCVASVTLKGVSKRFGTRVAINNLTLHVQDQEFLVLVGPSGCGKSTVLRLVAGLIEPSSGDIYLGERRITGMRAAQRDVAMVFQNYALYPHMTVFDNMAFPLRLRNVSKQDIEKKVKDTAEMLGISGLLRNKPKELSGGERQRVALGRAIVREPQVFLMDEPLSNLDAKLRVQTRGELVRLQRRLRTTTIYVTHDQSEAMTMGDRIAVLHEGDLLQVDEPQRIYDHPRNVFVGSFFGNFGMNFFACRVQHGQVAIQLENELFELPLLSKPNENFPKKEGQEMTIGVRPEDIRVFQSRYDQGFPAEVELVETLGNEKLVHLISNGSSFVARTSATDELVVGEQVCVEFSPERLRFFDPQTGETIC